VLGFYNPRTEPATVHVDERRLFHWMTNGAQPSNAVHTTLKSVGTWERWERFKQGETLEVLQQEAEQSRPQTDPRTRRDDLATTRRRKRRRTGAEGPPGGGRERPWRRSPKLNPLRSLQSNEPAAAAPIDLGRAAARAETTQPEAETTQPEAETAPPEADMAQPVAGAEPAGDEPKADDGAEA
jgi:hypothetical protein